MKSFDIDFIRRVVAALRAKAKEGKRYAHLAAHANYMEREAQSEKTFYKAGRTAMRLNRVWSLGVK